MISKIIIFESNFPFKWAKPNICARYWLKTKIMEIIMAIREMKKKNGEGLDEKNQFFDLIEERNQ